MKNIQLSEDERTPRQTSSTAGRRTIDIKWTTSNVIIMNRGTYNLLTNLSERYGKLLVESEQKSL